MNLRLYINNQFNNQFKLRSINIVRVKRYMFQFLSTFGVRNSIYIGIALSSLRLLYGVIISQ